MSTSCVPQVPKRAPKRDFPYKAPPLDGSLTVPQIYDWHFKENADHAVFVFKPHDRDGLERLTYRQVVPAMHNAGRLVSRLVRQNAENLSEETGPVAIVSSADPITYFCTVAGMLRTNIPVVPIALINTEEAIAHLLKKTGATHVLVSEDGPTKNLAAAAISRLVKDDPSYQLKVIPMPRFGEIFRENADFDPLPPTTYNYTRPIIYVHSSGSTSLPKPIPWTHAIFLQTAVAPCFGSWDLRGEIVGIQAVSMAHAAGLNHIAFQCSSGYTAAIFAPGPPFVKPTPQNIMNSFRACKPSFVICVPSYLDSWSKHEQDLEFLKGLKGIAYGGGPLPVPLGDHLVEKGVSICTIYASSEGGIIGDFFPSFEGKDWLYFRLSPHVSVRCIDAGENTHEVIVVAAQTHSIPIINSMLEGKDAYASSDLLEKHPTRPGYWKVFGRVDDQITLSNGMKTNPGPIEDLLCDHEHVKAALVFGRGHTHVGVLVYMEAEAEALDAKSVRELLWPLVQRINMTVPRHSQIMKGMILPSSPSKPLLFTEKRTIRKGATLSQYPEEIAALFAEQGSVIPDVAPPASWTPESTLQFVHAIVKCVIPSIADDDHDLFDHGCTSFHALWISNAIVRALNVDPSTIPHGFLYRHPTIKTLATYALSIAQGDADTADHDGTPADEMRRMVERFTQSFPARSNATAPLGRPAKDTVLVTGTTGALGSMVLSKLVADKNIACVYALNRASPAGEGIQSRQEQALQIRGMDTSLAISSKVRLLEGDISLSDFGLSVNVLEEIRSSVTHIYHIGWPVDFNWNLHAFTEALTSVRNLVDFAASSRLTHVPRILFTSSSAIFPGPLPDDTRPISEIAVNDMGVVPDIGYIQAKCTAEQILLSAARAGCADVVVLRVGQLCGAPNGAWSTREWFPTMLRTSATLGKIPLMHGNVSWLPLDAAAAVLVEARSATHDILHVVHPRPASLDGIIGTIAEELGLSLCTYEEWLALLEPQTLLDDEAVQRLPALKALDFFRGLRHDDLEPAFASDNARAAAPTLSAIPQLGLLDVRSWIGYWQSVEFL